jgi:hypothetical protein
MPKPYIIINRKLNNYKFTRIKKTKPFGLFTVKPKKPKIRFKKKGQKKIRRLFSQKRVINLTLTRKSSNIFLTVLDEKGNVLTSRSAGNCKITSKKRKKSWDTFKAVAQIIIKILRLRNIKLIENFYLKYNYLKNFKIFSDVFKKSGLPINNLIFLNIKPHRKPLKLKKVRRL